MMIDKWLRLIDIQQKRYKKKGVFNILLALAILFSTMYASYIIGQRYWPSAIENKMSFVTIGSIVINLSMELIGFILYLPGYMGWSQYFREHIVNKNSLRPWERKNWPEVRSKTIYNFMLNQLIIYPAIVYLANIQGINVRLQGFPDFKQFCLQILFIYYFQDFLFYCFHRFFHAYTFTYKIHKMHHEYDTLYTWVAEYLNPLDYIFANLLPGAIPLMAMGNRLHCFTFFFWIFYKILLSCENHSGYQFEWSPLRVFPMIANTGHHDNHHSKNVGNYGGSCYFWDLMLDTYVPYCNEF